MCGFVRNGGSLHLDSCRDVFSGMGVDSNWLVVGVADPLCGFNIGSFGLGIADPILGQSFLVLPSVASLAWRSLGGGDASIMILAF